MLFTNGERVEADVVLCNTGFVRDWSYLSGVVPSAAAFTETRTLFKHMVDPDIGPSLSFVGWARPAEGGVPAIAEIQARYLALLLSGERVLPTDCRAQTRRDKLADEARFYIVPHMDSLVHYSLFMEELAELVGCKANLGAMFFTNNAMWRRLWFGSHLAAVYRLRGPGATPGVATETLQRLPVAWFANPLATRIARQLTFVCVVSFLCTPFGFLESSW